MLTLHVAYLWLLFKSKILSLITWVFSLSWKSGSELWRIKELDLSANVMPLSEKVRGKLAREASRLEVDKLT